MLCCRLDVLESWLSSRGPAVKILTIKDLRVWSDYSAEGEFLLKVCNSGLIPRIVEPCQASYRVVYSYDNSMFAQVE